MNNFQILALIVVLTLIPLLTGCPTSKPVDVPGHTTDTSDVADVESETDQGAVDTVDATSPESIETDDDDIVETTITDDGTTTRISESELDTVIHTDKLPEDWPEGVPVFDGYKIEAVVISEIPSTNEISTLVYAEGDITVIEAFEFYIALSGWDVADRTPLAADSSLGWMALTRGDEKLDIQIAMSEPEALTSLRITYSSPK